MKGRGKLNISCIFDVLNVFLVVFVQFDRDKWLVVPLQIDVTVFNVCVYVSIFFSLFDFYNKVISQAARLTKTCNVIILLLDPINHKRLRVGQ